MTTLEKCQEGLLAAPLGFEPRLTPSVGYGFRDRRANHYTTGQYSARHRFLCRIWTYYHFHLSKNKLSRKNLLYCVFLTFYKYYIIIFIIFQIKRILKSRWVVMFQPHAYATPTSQNSTSRISGVGFFTLIQGISTATYLTLPRLPRRPIRPEPFQYSLIGDPDGTWTRDL